MRERVTRNRHARGFELHELGFGQLWGAQPEAGGTFTQLIKHRHALPVGHPLHRSDEFIRREPPVTLDVPPATGEGGGLYPPERQIGIDQPGNDEDYAGYSPCTEFRSGRFQG